MIKIIIGFLIFCIILFLYLHIQFHLKTSDDLEIFEIDQEPKERLEEICNFRQPLLFELEPEHNKIIQNTNKQFLLESYPAFEVKIRDLSCDNNDEGDLYIPLPVKSAHKLFEEDTKSLFLSENIDDFLKETGIIKTIQQNDQYLRPSLVSNCNYDIMIASSEAITPFRYLLNYRNYFMVTQGSIQIKLTPPKNIKYLHTVYDYENFEFKSPVNPWNVQSKYQTDFEKMKCLEITLVPGKCLFLPAYWWYSFKFGKDSSITSFYYKTYMNHLAILPDTIMYILQNQNIVRKVAKKMDSQDDIHNLFEDYEKKNNVEDTNNDNTQETIVHNIN